MSVELETPETLQNVLSLHDQLMQLHDAYQLEVIALTTAKMLGNVIPDVSRQMNDDSFGGSTGIGDKSFCYTRMQMRAVNDAASTLGITPENGDTRLGKEDTAIIWQISEYGDVQLHFKDPEGTIAKEIKANWREQSKPFIGLAEEVSKGSLEAKTEEVFNLDESGLDEMYTFMNIDSRASSYITAKQKFLERLYALPLMLPGDEHTAIQSSEGVYFDSDGSLLKILREVPENSGVYRGMYFAPGTRNDPGETEFHIGVEIDAERASLEKSYGRNLSRISFLESDTGKSIITTIENAGLAPAENFTEILASITRGVYDARYGNNYSEITRELARIIGVNGRGISELFIIDDNVMENLMNVDSSGIENGPARLLFSLLQQIVDPNRKAESNIPVHEGKVSIKSSSCKDAEYFFTQSINEGKFAVHDVEGKRMLHKHSGGPTAINLDPVIYKGVEIPAGGLFQRHYDRETKTTSYVFIRITSFAFNQEEAADAFTWQYDENASRNNMPSAEFVGVAPY